MKRENAAIDDEWRWRNVYRTDRNNKSMRARDVDDVTLTCYCLLVQWWLWCTYAHGFFWKKGFGLGSSLRMLLFNTKIMAEYVLQSMKLYLSSALPISVAMSVHVIQWRMMFWRCSVQDASSTVKSADDVTTPMTVTQRHVNTVGEVYSSGPCNRPEVAAPVSDECPTEHGTLAGLLRRWRWLLTIFIFTRNGTIRKGIEVVTK